MNSSFEKNLQTPHFRGLNGIRALAVLLVILFHLNVTTFSGGYIGVDVFFVISGFLITRIILRDEKKSEFSFATFFIRRTRRLFPALFVTCIITFGYAAIYLSPYQLARTAKGTLGALASISNFIYLPTNDYFAPRTPNLPLLHTWSLGVEEQFYLFWPLFLIAARKFFRNWVFLAISVLWVVSFFSAASLIHWHAKTVFYLTPFRIWEFATGALLLLVPRQEKALGNVLIVLGCAMIFYCATNYDKETVFPGLTALGPCLGAAALIVGSESRASILLLGNPISDYIGKISYSLYLVHWPLVLHWILQHGKVSTDHFLTLMSITLALGVALHHGVEARFRIKQDESRKFGRTLAAIGIAAVSITILASTNAYITDGWRWRSNEDVRSLLVKQRLATVMRHGECFLAINQTISDMPKHCYETNGEQKNLLILGTSRAADLYRGIAIQFDDWNVHQITAARCYPVLSLEKPDYCLELNRLVFEELIPSRNYDLVVLGGMQEKDIGDRWIETAQLFDAYGVDYVVMGPRSHYKRDLHTLIWEHNSIDGLDPLVQALRKPNPDFHQAIGDANHYFSINKLLCLTSDDCNWQIDGALLYNDQSHFSEAGSIYVAKHLKRWFEQTRNNEIEQSNQPK